MLPCRISRCCRVLRTLFDVTVDDLFGRRTKPPKYIRSWEDLPVWIYDLILNNMWDDDMPRKESFAEYVKKHWQTYPNNHSGFVSQNAGGSLRLQGFSSFLFAEYRGFHAVVRKRESRRVLQFLADKAVRAVLKYQYENRTRSFTAALVCFQNRAAGGRCACRL